MSLSLNTKLKRMAGICLVSSAAGIYVYYKLIDSWHGLLAWLACAVVAIFVSRVMLSIWPVRDSSA